MKVSQEFVGKVVAVQFARPTYMFEYAAHVTYKDPATGAERTGLVPHPVQVPKPSANPEERPLAVAMERDMLTAVTVVTVTDDSVTLEILMPIGDGSHGQVVRKTVPSALILSIDEIVSYDEMPMPVITKFRRQLAEQGPSTAPASKIIL